MHNKQYYKKLLHPSSKKSFARWFSVAQKKLIKFLSKNKKHSYLGGIITLILVTAIATIVAQKKPTAQNHTSTPLFKKQIIGPWDYKSTSPTGDLEISLGKINQDKAAKVRVARDNTKVEFKLPLNLTQVEYKKETVSYKNTQQNIEVSYQMRNNGVKEEIIIHDPGTENVFTSSLSTSGLTMKKTRSGEILFFDDKGQYQFHFEKPFATDAKGNTTYAVSYRLVSKDNQNLEFDQPEVPNTKELLNYSQTITTPSEEFNLIVEVDPIWFFDKNRQFPITIDPTVIHDESSEFTSGDFNQTADSGATTNPKIENYYQELRTDQGTLGLWHFNEGSHNTCSGGEDVCDYSGNGYHATFAGTAAFYSITVLGDYASILDGDSDYLTTSLDIDQSTGKELTIEAWAYPTDTPASRAQVVSSDNGGFDWSLLMNTGTWRVFTGSAECNTGVAVDTNTWQHVAVVYTEKDVLFYKDGEMKYNCGAPGYDTGDNNINIGKNPGGTEYFPGAIDEVRISNIARTPAEIESSAQRRPWGIYTSGTIDFGVDGIAQFNNLYWTAEGIATGDGETATASAETSLIGQWNFNETSGTTADNAEGTSGIDGTLTGFTDTTGQDVAVGSGWTSNSRWGAGALMFNGSSDYVSLGTDTSLNLSGSDFTLEAWIKPNNTTAFGEIIGKGINTDYEVMISDAGKIKFLISNGTHTELDSNTILQTGRWYHVVVTRDFSTTTGKIYINGVLDNSTTSFGDSTTTNSSNPVLIGARTTGTPALFFDGTIDSPKIYSSVLTASEIQSNYNSSQIQFQTRTSTDGSTWEEWKTVTGESQIEDFDFTNLYNTTDTGLVAYLDMDETADNTCTGGEDVCDSKNSNDATIYNGETIATNSGVIANGRLFDGTDDYGVITDNSTLDFTNTATLETWLKVNDTNSPISNFSSWTSLTAPTGTAAYSVNDGVDTVIVGNKIYYAAYLHSDATEYFYTAYSDLDGSNFSGWNSQTAPNGAGAGESTSVAIDSDGTNLYYAAFAHDGAVESFYTTSSDLTASTFNSWTTQTAPDGSNVNNGSGIDMVITGGKMYFSAFMNTTSSTLAYGTIFSTAYADLDGTNFNGWTVLTDPVAGGYVDASNVGMDTDGNYLYYAAFSNRDATEYLRTGYSSMDGSWFSGWTTQTAPDGAGTNDLSFGSATIAGGRIYMSYYGHTDTTQTFSTADMAINGYDFSGWTTQTSPALTVGARDGTTSAMTTDGKKIYYFAFAFDDTTTGLKMATADINYQPILYKEDAYELIQNGNGFILDWNGRPTSFTSRSEITETPNGIGSGEWNQLAMTMDGSTMNFYINGSITRFETTTNDFSSNANNLYIASDTTNYFNGSIDEVRLYNSAQSSVIIKDHYHQVHQNPDMLYIKPDTVIKTEGTSSLSITGGKSKVSGDTVLYLPLDETNGDNTGDDVFDQSIYGHNGEFVGLNMASNPVDGYIGKARKFDGSTDYITISDGSDFSLDEFTISAWIYRTSDSGDYEMIMDNRDSTFDGWNMAITDTDLLRCLHNDGYADSTTTLETNKWYYVACTSNGNAVRTFVNGTAEGSDTGYTNTTSETATTYIGVRGITSQIYHFPGYIDEIKISNTAHSSQSIAEEYRSAGGRNLNYNISSTDLSSKGQISFDVAADEVGSYLEAEIGESSSDNHEIDSDTIALWSFEESSDSCTASIGDCFQDSSQNEYWADPNDDPQTVPGKIGRGLRTDGTTGNGVFLMLNDEADLYQDAITDDFSYGFWFKPNISSGGDSAARIITRDGDYWMVTVDQSTGTGITVRYSNSETTGAIPISYNSWHHISGVWNGTENSFTFYLDGEKIFTDTSLGSFSTSSRPIVLGGNTEGDTDISGNQFNGIVDEVRFTNTPRTAASIKREYEKGLKTFPINVDFKAALDSSNLITSSADYSFIIDATTYGANDKGSNIFSGDKIIVKENIDGVEYKAQATVSSTSESTGAVNVTSWDTGSTFPSGGFTTDAIVYKWQKVILDISQIDNSYINATDNITLRSTTPHKGFEINIDDLKSNTNYLNDPYGSSITSTVNRYFQYRSIFTSLDYNLSAQLTSVTIDYTDNAPPSPPTSLETETLTNPSDVSDATPEFSAIYNDLDTSDTGEYYRIQVNTEPDFTGTSMWDSGQTVISSITEGTRSSLITYAGTSLEANTTYYWRIKFWDDNGNEGDWSTESAYFSTSSIATPAYCNIEELSDDSQLTVQWTDDNSVEDNYVIEKNTNGAGFSTFQTVAANSTSYDDTSVSQGNTYAYRIKAIDGDFSTDWCTTSSLSLQSGSFNFEGLNMEGLNLN